MTSVYGARPGKRTILGGEGPHQEHKGNGSGLRPQGRSEVRTVTWRPEERERRWEGRQVSPKSTLSLTCGSSRSIWLLKHGQSKIWQYLTTHPKTNTYLHFFSSGKTPIHYCPSPNYDTVLIWNWTRRKCRCSTLLVSKDEGHIFRMHKIEYMVWLQFLAILFHFIYDIL
jgi:hypothetical protein